MKNQACADASGRRDPQASARKRTARQRNPSGLLAAVCAHLTHALPGFVLSKNVSAKEWILFALAALGLLPREERPGFARTPSDTEMITVLASVPVRDRAAAAGVFRPLARLWPQLRMYFDNVLSPRSCLGFTRGSTQTDSLRLMRPDGRPAPSSPHFPDCRLQPL